MLPTPQQVVSELKYESYIFNRGHSPDITPYQWKLIFGEDVEWMEERYQKEAESNDTPQTTKEISVES